jgi:hypothetical protein
VKRPAQTCKHVRIYTSVREMRPTRFVRTSPTVPNAHLHPSSTGQKPVHFSTPGHYKTADHVSHVFHGRLHTITTLHHPPPIVSQETSHTSSCRAPTQLRTESTIFSRTPGPGLQTPSSPHNVGYRALPHNTASTLSFSRLIQTFLASALEMLLPFSLNTVRVPCKSRQTLRQACTCWTRHGGCRNLWGRACGWKWAGVQRVLEPCSVRRRVSAVRGGPSEAMDRSCGL